MPCLQLVTLFRFLPSISPSKIKEQTTKQTPLLVTDHGCNTACMSSVETWGFIMTPTSPSKCLFLRGRLAQSVRDACDLLCREPVMHFIPWFSSKLHCRHRNPNHYVQLALIEQGEKLCTNFAGQTLCASWPPAHPAILWASSL